MHSSLAEATGHGARDTIGQPSPQCKPPNAFLRRGRYYCRPQLPTSFASLPLEKDVASLDHASSLPALSCSSSEHTQCDGIDGCANHLVPRRLLGPEPHLSDSISLNLGPGRFISRGNPAFCLAYMFSHLSELLSSVPLHGEDACLISMLAFLSLRGPPLRRPVAPRYQAIT